MSSRDALVVDGQLSRPSLVVLDLFGTICHWLDPIHSPAHLIWLKSPRRSTLELSELIKMIDGADGQELVVGGASPDDFEQFQIGRWRQAMAFADVTDDEGNIDICREIVRRRRLGVYPDVPPFLGWLAMNAIPWTVCSNASPDVWPKLGRMLPAARGIAGDLALSWQVGVLKPHPKMYRALAVDAARRAEVIFVGDRWVPDVIGPVTFGFRAFHLVRVGHARPHHASPHERYLGQVGALNEVSRRVHCGTNSPHGPHSSSLAEERRR